MLTPQEVSSHAFPKAVMGGYNMSSVDEFLDEVTDDYTALYKENTTLKAKLKVLVEKVEDYRATEDSMRATLLTAQRMADSIVKEAESKRDQILTKAESDAQARIEELKKEYLAAQERLKTGQRELGEFVCAARAACEKELSFLEELPQLPVETPETDTRSAAGQEPEEPIEESIFSRIKRDEEAQEQTAAEAEEAVQQAEAASEEAQPADDYPEGDPFRPDEPTRRLDLDGLKFGRNYNGQN